MQYVPCLHGATVLSGNLLLVDRSMYIHCKVHGVECTRRMQVQEVTEYRRQVYACRQPAWKLCVACIFILFRLLHNIRMTLQSLNMSTRTYKRRPATSTHTLFQIRVDAAVAVFNLNGTVLREDGGRWANQCNRACGPEHNLDMSPDDSRNTSSLAITVCRTSDSPGPCVVLIVAGFFKIPADQADATQASLHQGIPIKVTGKCWQCSAVYHSRTAYPPT